MIRKELLDKLRQSIYMSEANNLRKSTPLPASEMVDIIIRHVKNTVIEEMKYDNKTD